MGEDVTIGPPMKDLTIEEYMRVRDIYDEYSLEADDGKHRKPFHSLVKPALKRQVLRETGKSRIDEFVEPTCATNGNGSVSTQQYMKHQDDVKKARRAHQKKEDAFWKKSIEELVLPTEVFARTQLLTNGPEKSVSEVLNRISARAAVLFQKIEDIPIDATKRLILEACKHEGQHAILQGVVDACTDSAGVMQSVMLWERKKREAMKQFGLLEPPTSSTSKKDVQKQEQGQKKLHCYNCGGGGHMAKDCPEPKIAGGTRRCYRCGKVGHVAKDCPDASKPDQCLVFASGVGSKVWECSMSVGLKEHVVRLDTCASSNFIPPELAREWGIRTKWADRWVKLGDNSTARVLTGGSKKVRLALKKDVDVTLHWDVIAGCKPTICFRTLAELGLINVEATTTDVDGDEELLATMDEQIREEYADCFGPADGAADLKPYKISLSDDAVPYFELPRRRQPEIEQALSGHLKKLEEAKIIRRSKSPWSSRVVMAKKKGGEWRPCINYIRLNKFIEDPQHDLPAIDDIMTMLEGKVKFAALDASSAFHQVPVEEGTQELLAFTTPDGHFTYNTMPFGLSTAAGHMQAALEEAFADMLGTACLIYVDDILVFGETVEEYEANLRHVMDRVRERKIKLNEKKCAFNLDEVEYLGWTVSKEGRSVPEWRVEGVQKLAPAHNVSDVRALLGIFNFFAKFIPGYADLAEPIRRMELKDAPPWGPDQDRALEALKKAVTSAPVLTHPDPAKRLALYTDASDKGVGAVLMQEDEGGKRPIMFLSKALSGSQRRWSTYRKEAFAIVHAIRKARRLLATQEFKVWCDHRNLAYVWGANDDMVQRWALELANYKFDVEHVPGSLNEIADGLSRAALAEEQAKQEQEDIPDQSRTESDEDGPAAAGAETEESKPRPQGQLLFRVDEFRTTQEASPTLPESQKEARFKEVHGAGKGHHGVQQTLWKLEDIGLSWDGAEADVSTMVKRCPVCQKSGMGGDPYQSSAARAAGTVWSSVRGHHRHERGRRRVPEHPDSCGRNVAMGHPGPAEDSVVTRNHRGIAEVLPHPLPDAGRVGSR
ncbi:Zinc knuckle [Carpediemonas membranifera]|uniref:Zinc knuckle n=1 Tax=Carpediemonas membranifera TaxID=201153 RepID=A0A8J6AZE2_9EUKA|nr:Zinc knuckle [Carpediemonas membranifera]|eukprot:KAG9389657.1 Zinc knuckle [Carpediemonas membranifera]